MIYTDGVHLISSISTNPLHVFAQKIGLKRCWFRAKSHPHYDLTTEKKTGIAIKAGAKLVSSKELIRALRGKND